jgi:lipoate-protein ligase A
MNAPGGPVRRIELGAASFARTQAVYHAVAESLTADSPDTVILTRPREPHLCLGWHDVYADVLDRERCREQKLPVLRRRVGGGTTYLDAGQPYYQFVFHHSRLPAVAAKLYGYLLAAPVAALRRIGTAAELRGLNEIEVQGRRIAGIGGGRIGEAAVVVGNILCGFDFGMLPRVWNAPFPAFRELAAHALRERLVTLRDLRTPENPESVFRALREVLPDALGRPVVLGDLTDEEWARTEDLERELGAPDFLDLHAGRGYGALRRLKIAAETFVHAESVEWRGSVRSLALLVRGERIEAVRLDGASESEQQPLECALRGRAAKDWRTHLDAA